MTSLPAGLRGRRIEWLATAVLIGVALWYWLQFFDRSTNLLDEGSTAAQAMRVVNGELIYRDFFTVVTPGSYYTVAWLFQIFGPQLMVLRWAALATGIGILLATLFVTRRLAPWPFAAAAALMTTVWGWFLVTPNFYSLEAALFAMLALACYLRGWIVAAGIAAGLAALTKQNVGAYAAAALLLSTWLPVPDTGTGVPVPDTGTRVPVPDTGIRVPVPGTGTSRLRTTARLIGGICVVVVPVLIWLIAAGAGPYLYESWIYYPLAKYPQRFALAYPELLPVVKAVPALIGGNIPEPAIYDFWTGVILHLPHIVLPLTAIAVLTSKDNRRDVITVALFALFSLLQAWPRADTTHILFGLQPTFSLFAYLLTTLAVVRRPGRTAMTAVAMVPVLVLLWYGYKRTTWEYQNYVAGLHAERGRGISTLLLEAQRIDNVTKYIVEHTTPDDRIFVVPWAAGFYFLADRSNPTRTDFMLFEDPEAYPCLIARLDQQPPKYVIYGYTWDVDDKRFRDYAAPVDQYIRSRYAIEFTTDGYEIWRRSDDAPQAAGSFPRACQPRKFRLDDLF